MAIIDLSRGYTAIVDDCDLDRLCRHTWWANCSESVAAFTTVKKRTVLMHRFIMNVADGGPEIDHIDRNPLNNTRENLRFCSHSQNVANSIRRVKPASGFRGVYLDKRDMRWSANVYWGDRNHSAGRFATAIEAAKARDDLAIKIHQEFAVLNFPERYKGNSL